MQNYLKHPGDQFDQRLIILINAVSLYFEKECGGRIFIEKTYSTMYLDGTSKKRLLIPHYPITSITSVHENDVLLTGGADYDTSYDYVIYGAEGEGYLWKASGWAEGLKNIKLTDLKAGYTLANVPADLKSAAMILIGKEFEKANNKAGAEETRVFPDASITWNFDQDEFVKKTITKYTRQGL
jgi:hypothetical protein